MTVDGAKLAILIRPVIPDADAVCLQVTGIRVAGKKPEQFVNNGFEVQLLRGDERKARSQIEAHLMAENAACARARAVGLRHARVAHKAHEVEILLHWPVLRFALPSLARWPPAPPPRRNGRNALSTQPDGL